MNKIYKVFHYFTLIKFKKGINLSYNLTWRCNLKCPYCAETMPTGSIPKCNKEVPISDIIDNIDIWKKLTQRNIRCVQLSGGSPELYKDFVELTNYLLSKGYFVHVNTNLLHINKLLQIKQSRKFLIVATYHHSSNPFLFKSNYDILSKKYQIIVDEIKDDIYKNSWHISVNTSKVFSFSKLKPLVDIDTMKQRETMIRMNPDLTKIALSCYNACL